MDASERSFLRDFFRSLSDKPLEPSDPAYVPIYSDVALEMEDPVELVARAIEWTQGDTVQLLSGFKGNGKSTELRRLRRRLQESRYRVLMIDIEDYLETTSPVDISDFLMIVAAGFGDTAVEHELLPVESVKGGFWDRFRQFIDRRPDLSELAIEAGVPGAFKVGLKAALKSDPKFRQRLQQRMAGHIGALVSDVRLYIQEIAGQIRDRDPDGAGIVFLVDSVEHIRGTIANAEVVQQSVEMLFTAHAERLRLPSTHVVYTVPPYLRVRYPNLGALYEPGGVQMLHAVKVRERGSGVPFEPGIAALEQVLRARGDLGRLIPNRDSMKQVVLGSGGHLRDLLRILLEVIRRADRIPVPAATVDLAINQIKGEFSTIPDDDARWLHAIHESGEPSLKEMAALPTFARFLETHEVLCYRNGGDWYDTHPMITSEVGEQARRVTQTELRAPREDVGS